MRKDRWNIVAKMARSLKLESLIRLSGQTSIFPFYHTVSAKPLPHLLHLYDVLKPDEFERDLDQILLYFEPQSMADYLANKGGKKGRRSMVLSFDDGLKGCYDHIAPLLKRKGIPAVFFLNNRFIGNKGLFYRYKASLLVQKVREDCRALEQVADYLKISRELVETSILMIGWEQRALLDVLAGRAELDYPGYMGARPVYMSSAEIEEMLTWGFDMGAHSNDHREFAGMDAEQIKAQIKSSITDLQNRFDIQTAYFSFPFTSDGIPGRVIDTLLGEGSATALLGTAGIKKTGRRSYIQRIPMDNHKTGALETLRTEYFYYLLKMPLGRNRLRQ